MDSTQDSPVSAITKASPTWPIRWSSQTDVTRLMFIDDYRCEVDCSNSCTVRRPIYVDRGLLGHPEFGSRAATSIAGLLVCTLDEWLVSDYSKHIGEVKGSKELCQPLNNLIERYRESDPPLPAGLLVSVIGALPPDTFDITHWNDQWNKGEPVEYSITATLCDLEGENMTDPENTDRENTATLIIEFFEKKAHENSVAQEEAGQSVCKLHPPSDDRSDGTVNLLKKPVDTDESATADQAAE